MKWLAVWLLLTGTYLTGWVLTAWALHSGPVFDRESLAHLAAIPLAQAAALRGLTAFRRMFKP